MYLISLYFRESQEKKGQKDLVDLRAQEEEVVQLELKVLQEIKDHKEHLVNLESQEPREARDSRAVRDPVVWQDSLEAQYVATAQLIHITFLAGSPWSTRTKGSQRYCRTSCKFQYCCPICVS